MSNALLIQSLSLGIVLSVVCRAVKMSARTASPVRYAMVAQGGAAFAVFMIPFGRPELLDWLVAGFILATLAVQLATARYWSRGQPKSFERL